MNKQRFKIINDILQEKPTRLRESYFIKNYNDVYNKIVKYTEGIDLPFKQRMWHWINELPTIYVCKCGKPTSFYKNWKHGYRSACSPKCAQTNDKTKEKRRKTTLEKYGVDNIAKLEEIKKKQEETNIQKYGHKSTFQNEEVQKKWRKTIEDRYSVDHYFKTNEFKKKAKKTSKKKYGKEHYVQSKSYKEKLKEIGFNDILKQININKHLRKYDNIGLEFIDLSDRILTLKGECGHQFEIHYDSLKRRIENSYDYCTICNPVNSVQSQDEKVLIKWLMEKNIDLVEKDRSLGIELDILIPSKKIAIEFNGLYWHSELFKNNNYHLDKTTICRNNDIRLIHIWEDDWKYNKTIVKSIILNSLGLIEKKVYSRKCEITTLSNKEKNLFLEKNHIQGKCVSSVNLALMYNNEVVSVMTFGKRKMSNKNEFELIRFCNKVNNVVIGGASRLFNYFINNYQSDHIISFADISHFEGGVYKKLGFKFVHRTIPNYWWVVSGIRFHRFTYNKKRLVKEGADPNKTEVQIMYDKGYFRIFGCGQDKYVYHR
jgi:hypothetical protein